MNFSTDILSKAKDKAENLGHQLQAKAESAGLAPVSPNTQRKKRPPRPNRPPKLNLAEPPSAPSLVLEIARVCGREIGSVSAKWQGDG